MFNETKRDARAEDAYSGATEMKRKRRNVDTRAGKKRAYSEWSSRVTLVDTQWAISLQ